MEEYLKLYHCQNPVVLIVFNRPEETKILLEAIKKVTPKQLYVISDGPRKGVANDIQTVNEVRQVIDSIIDWDCQVKKIYADSNMRGPIRVPSGLDEVFSIEEQVIILEDDCIPSISFFKFCDELLERYRDDLRVGTVCGFNLEFDFWGGPVNKQGDHSYFFSKYPASWGWATWRRVWNQFDHELNDFPSLINDGYFNSISNRWYIRDFWIKKFRKFYLKQLNNWDYKLTYSLLKNGQLSIIPSNNLVRNIGTESGANFKKKDYVSLKKSKEIVFPLNHPVHFQANYAYDHRVSSQFFNNSYFSKAMRIMRNYLLKFRD